MNSQQKHQLLKLVNGKFYFRFPDKKQRKNEGQAYKQGYEVRLVAKDKIELKKLQSLLKDLGFDIGKPFSKGSQFVQPVYGKYQVEKLKTILKKSK
jgi:hypothetical protein